MNIELINQKLSSMKCTKHKKSTKVIIIVNSDDYELSIEDACCIKFEIDITERSLKLLGDYERDNAALSRKK